MLANTDGPFPKLSADQFKQITQRVYDLCGIELRQGKETLVASRLAKRLRALSLPDYDAYLRKLGDDPGGDEVRAMIDVLTTNKTSFMREPRHFDFLREFLCSRVDAVRSRAVLDVPLRIWSAGCSSGEEPLTIAMTVRESWPKPIASRARILATDICSQVLARARQGTYTSDVISDIPTALLHRYFEPEAGSRWRASPSLLSMIGFARLNLMEQWPMRGPFDAIFCRNVMIYFDKKTQEQLVGRFYQLLRPGGYLFVGHSESLTGVHHSYDYTQPGVYTRPVS